jgi:hypothetical protein
MSTVLVGSLEQSRELLIPAGALMERVEMTTFEKSFSLYPQR